MLAGMPLFGGMLLFWYTEVCDIPKSTSEKSSRVNMGQATGPDQDKYASSIEIVNSKE